MTVNVRETFASLVESVGDSAIKRSQEIPDQFFDDLAAQRLEGSETQSGEYWKVASIPAVVVEQWMREGFNIYEAPAKDIVKRLRRLGYDKLFATSKSVFVE